MSNIICAICEREIEAGGFLNTAIGDVCRDCLPHFWVCGKPYTRTPYMRETLDEWRDKEAKENVKKTA